MRSTLCLVMTLIIGSSGRICDKSGSLECMDTNEVHFNQETDWKNARSIYDFHARDIHGNDVSFEKYRGHVVIIVNVASYCDLADVNYKQLQRLYRKYGKLRGLRILAFPSNQFGGLEPGSNHEIFEFIKRYNVTFDVFEKIDVKGENAHPLYKWFKHLDEIEGVTNARIKWNFTKILVDRHGQLVFKFAPVIDPIWMEESLLELFNT